MHEAPHFQLRLFLTVTLERWLEDEAKGVALDRVSRGPRRHLPGGPDGEAQAEGWCSREPPALTGPALRSSELLCLNAAGLRDCILLPVLLVMPEGHQVGPQAVCREEAQAQRVGVPFSSSKF